MVIQAVGMLILAGGCFSPTEDQNSIFSTGGTTAKCVSPGDAERLADQVLQLVNLERAERDLQPVLVNPKLTKIADDYACRMIEGDFFGHEDPLNGYGAMQRAATEKYMFYAIGENLAAGPETSAEVMKAWMESPAHRDIILDASWREIGIAVRTGGEFSIYWVQEFGDPAGS